MVFAFLGANSLMRLNNKNSANICVIKMSFASFRCNLMPCKGWGEHVGAGLSLGAIIAMGK